MLASFIAMTITQCIETGRKAFWWLLRKIQSAP